MFEVEDEDAGGEGMRDIDVSFWERLFMMDVRHFYSLIIIMSSRFEGWTAFDIVGPLNKSEVRAALLNFQIPKSSFRTWDTIEEMILSTSDEVKTVVYESALVKKKVEEEHRIAGIKRRVEERKILRNVCRRLGGFCF